MKKEVRMIKGAIMFAVFGLLMYLLTIHPVLAGWLGAGMYVLYLITSFMRD
jgi:hypothetical protein